MDYLTFDLTAVALPAVLLSRGTARAAVRRPAALLAAVALVWTAPWDDHLVRSGVWSYAAGAVHGRVGAVPVEEYLFVVLEVALVAAWALRAGLLPEPAELRAGPRSGSAAARSALPWAMAAAAGSALLLAGGPLRYLGLLLVWAGPPLALQAAVGGDVLAARRPGRLATALPVALWLCVADRLAIGAGLWTITPSTSLGLTPLGLPVEEAVFFALTCLLVTDGLLLACSPAVRRRLRVPARLRPAACGGRRATEVGAGPGRSASGSGAAPVRGTVARPV